MKTRNTLCAALLLSLCANILLSSLLLSASRTPPQPEPVIVEVPILQENTSDWDTFILALAWVESRWDTQAEGPTNDLGWLQITPIMVKDANRIVGYDKYTLEDRLDKDKSIEIFNVIQDEYNPDHDIQLALKIQNPYCKVSYHRAVIDKYNELMQAL